MRDYLRRSAIFFGSVAMVPFVMGLLGAFSFGLAMVFALLGLPTAAFTLLIGTVVWFINGIREAKQASGRRERVVAVLASPALCVATLLIAWPMAVAGSWIGDFARLALNHSHYEAIIEAAHSVHDTNRYGEDGGVTYMVDPGPPVRVAFNPEGMLDNWSGIIFDPTGEVMQADGWDASGKFIAPDRITKLFGGDLVSCRRLWGDYYKCSFT